MESFNILKGGAENQDFPDTPDTPQAFAGVFYGSPACFVRLHKFWQLKRVNLF